MGKAEQSDRFTADVAARAAGQFAGWPVDTVGNLVNLGRATIGEVPESLRLVGRGVNAVGGEYLGALNPARGLNWLANMIEPSWPRPELQGPIVGGSSGITKGYRELLALTGSPREGVAPSGPLQDFAGNVGEMTGGALSMGAPKTGIDLARLLASTVGAETGRRAGEAVAPGSTVAPIVGALAGGVAAPSIYGTGGPTVNTIRALTKAGPEMSADLNTKAGPVAQSIIENSIRSRVAGFPEAAGNIDEALRLQGKFPGVELSLAEMAGAPGLADMQSRFASLTPKNLNREVARQGSNTAALRAEMESRLPGDAKTSQNEPRNAVNRTLAEQDKALAGREGALPAELANVSQRGAGESLLSAAQAEREAAKATIVRPAYKKAFDLAGETKIDVAPVIAEAEGILGRKLSDFAPETAPNTVRLLKTFEPKKSAEQTFFGEPVFVPEGAAAAKPEATLQQLDDVRKAINADIQQAKTSGAPMADTTLMNLRNLHGAIDEAVASSGLSEAAKTAYNRALDVYRTQYVPRFKTGVNANLFRQTSLNEPRLNPDDVVKTYFQPGGEREAGQFVSMFGKNRDAVGTAKAGIEDLYRSKVVNPETGLVDPAAHARFMQQYARPIGIMDKAGMGIGDRLSGIGQRAEELAGARKVLDEKATALKFDTADDMKAAVLGSPVKMGAALREMDDKAKGALARSLLEDAWRPVAKGAPKAGEQFGTYLSSNERTLKMAMGAAETPKVAATHFSDLQDIAKTLQMIERADVKGKLVGGAGNDPLKATTGVSIPTVYAQTRAVLAGRQGVGTAVAMVAAPALTKLSQVQFDEVMNRALHDPKAAAALRDYLNASPAQAPGKAAVLSEVWDAAKATAKKAPGFVAKYWAGAPNYPSNVSRLAPAFAHAGSDEQGSMVDRIPK